MLRVLKRLSSPPPASSQPESVGAGLAEMRAALAQAISDELERGGIPADCVHIEVQRQGDSPQGLPTLAGMLRLVRWNDAAAVRLMLGLPLLERNMRRSLRNHWLADVARFAGLWLHPSTTVLGRETLDAVRNLVLQVEAQRSQQSQPPRSVWTIPSVDTDLGPLGPGDSPTAPGTLIV